MRWRPNARAIDVALAIVVAAMCVVEDVITPGDHGVANVAVAAAFGLPLLLRRTSTIWAAGAFLALAGLHVVVDNTPDRAAAAWFSSMLLAYAAGRHGRRWWTVPELLVLIAGNDVLWGLNDKTEPLDFFFPAFFITLLWLGGRAVRWDVRAVAIVHEESTRVLERAEQEREEVQAAERRRIAREMHDVIAHSVSVMVVQAGGARRILATDPARAVEAATLIESTGREALAELRTLLGVIDSEPERSGAPAPSLMRLDELVERGGEAGLAIDVQIDGTVDDLPAGVDMAAYRIVQEALTNALRHAGPVAATVTVARSPGAVELVVVNDPPSGDHIVPDLTRPGGHGLLGMAERAGLYGGELSAGPTEAGGFAVRTRLTFEHHREEATA